MAVLESVRARLALWYAGAFALFLALLAVGAYVFLARATLARTDEYLVETADALAGDVEGATDEGLPDSTAIAEAFREFHFRDLAVALYEGTTGAALALSPAQARIDQRGTAVDASPALAELVRRSQDEGETYVTRNSGDGDERLLATPFLLGERPLVIVVSRSLAAHEQVLREARYTLLLAIPVALSLATAGGYVLARKSLQPVVAMSEQAARIGASTLEERLPVVNPRDELGRLASVFNDLLGRLARSFEQQRQFMADASHELRTPVAIISGEAELTLSREQRTSEEYRSALSGIGEETRRLAKIVDDCFLLAHADAGDRPLLLEELYVDELADECVRAVRTLAARKSVDVELATDGELPFRGDQALLRRMLINLLDNAIKYTPSGGRVRVAASRLRDQYHLTVADNGPGIPVEARQRLFERFFRVQRARVAEGSDGGGAGLGLAIARWIAEKHGGRLELARSDESGSEFEITLPRQSSVISEQSSVRGTIVLTTDD
jgi:heavy metal sensor kinase